MLAKVLCVGLMCFCLSAGSFSYGQVALLVGRCLNPSVDIRRPSLTLRVWTRRRQGDVIHSMVIYVIIFGRAYRLDHAMRNILLHTVLIRKMAAQLFLAEDPVSQHSISTVSWNLCEASGRLHELMVIPRTTC
jgi:hypothetical protein